METEEKAPEKIVDPQIVKAEIVQYLGNVIDRVRELVLNIKDDESRDRAVQAGVEIRGKIDWLEAKRLKVYVPLRDALEVLRKEYDIPIELGTGLIKPLGAAVKNYDIKKRREEQLAREQQEAEAKRIRDEAARKERELEAARQKFIREQQEAEQRRRDALEAEAKREQEMLEAQERDRQEQARREQEERARRIREEEDSRLAHAQEAKDVGLDHKVDGILSRATPIAPVATMPTQADLDKARLEEEDRKRREEDERAAAERRRLDDEAEKKRRDEAEANFNRLRDETEAAKAKAEEAEAAAAATVSVTRPDDRIRTSVTWKYEVPDRTAFVKLVRAVADGRAPVEYLGFDPDHPEKFRATAIGKDVQKLKGEFGGEAIGIRAWPEESGSFKAAKAEAS